MSELRLKKKMLRERGLPHESEEADNTAKTPGIKGELDDAHTPDFTPAVAEGEAGDPGAAADADDKEEPLGTERAQNDATTSDVAPAGADASHGAAAIKTEGEPSDPEAAAAPPPAAAEGGSRDPPVAASRETEPGPTADPRAGNTYLTCSRVQRLDALGFVWSSMPDRFTWDERLEQLRRFKEEHGRWPANRDGTIGNWLKNQKKLFSKKDADFMANLCPKVRTLPGRLSGWTICALPVFLHGSTNS